MPEITTRPRDMTAAEYRQYQGGTITGYLQSFIYCRKVFQESNERLALLKQSYQEYLILLAKDAVNDDLFGEYEIEDCIDPEIDEIEAYHSM